MNNANVCNYAFPYNWRRPSGFLANLVRAPKIFKWSWQRINRGFADCDVWDFDCYLTSIIPLALRKLTEGCSYPHAFGSAEEWHNYLEEVASKIEYGAEDEIFWFPENYSYTMDEYTSEMKKRKNTLQEGLAWIAEHINELWD